MNLGDFRTAVAAKIGLTLSDSSELALIDGWVNEGVTDVQMRTGCTVTSGTLTETAGDGDYDLDVGILNVIGWSWANDTTYVSPERVSVPEILRLRQSSVASSPPAAYAVAGTNLLMVFPTPTAADTITVYYVPRPVTLSASGDVPSEIPTEFHKAIEYYALSEAADYDDDGSSGNGQAYRQEYQQWLKTINKQVLTTGGTLPRATVNPGRRRRPFHDNSVYTSY